MVAGVQNESDGLDAFGLTECKFFDGDWRQNKTNGFDGLGLIECKFCNGCQS